MNHDDFRIHWRLTSDDLAFVLFVAFCCTTCVADDVVDGCKYQKCVEHHSPEECKGVP